MTTKGRRRVPPHPHVIAGLGHSDTGEITFDRLTTLAGSPALERSSEQHSAYRMVHRVYLDRHSAPYASGAIAAVEWAHGHARTGRGLPRHSPAMETREAGVELLTQAARLDLSALGEVEIETSAILNINSHGLGNSVHTVVSAIRKYFGDIRLELEWEEGPDATSPVAITIVAPEELEDAYEILDRFDTEWWYRQEPSIHEVVGVHLA